MEIGTDFDLIRVYKKLSEGDERCQFDKQVRVWRRDMWYGNCTVWNHATQATCSKCLELDNA